jgi:ABC-type phosphate transport system auxiliary subunit
LDSDRKELLRAIGGSQKRLAERLVALERRTRDQVFGLNQAMKEAFAQERSECLDRADRRAIRERVALERQQMLRDMVRRPEMFETFFAQPPINTINIP